MIRIRRNRSALTLAGALLSAVGLLGGADTLRAQEDPVTEEIRDLADSVATADDAGYAWNDAVRLVAFRGKATAFVVDATRQEDATPLGRVALARVLLELGERGRAAEALLAVAGSDAPVSLRVDAIRLFEETGADEHEDELWAMLADALDPRLRAALAKSLWVLTKDIEAKNKLRELLRSDDFDIQVEGALALGEINDFNDFVTAVLQRIRREPTARGRLANALLSGNEWTRIAHDAAAAAEPGDGDTPSDPLQALLQDTVHRLKAFYVTPADLAAQTLWEGAARGMVDAIGDPYTTYQSADERDDWTDHLTKEYGGIGAYVGFDKDGFFIVTRPMFGGPAWKSNLRSGDRVVSVDGWQTAGEELTDIVKKLRGTPNEPVTIEIVKKGWRQPRKMTLTRGFIRVPTVYSDLLPGNVGFVLVDNFAKNTTEEFRNALKDLERRGAKYLVLDLRWNSGGYLRTAEQLADALLPKGKLVVETIGRPGMNLDELHETKGMGTEWGRTVPLRVLVNGASASASEILSGALQIHDRARVVGLRTYGKGSVQNLYPIYTQPFAEPFSDANRNGAWDDEEPFEDRNENRKWDAGERFYDADRNGRWTAAESFEDRNGNGRFDCPALKITIAKYYVGKAPGTRDIHPHRKEMIIAGRREWIGGIEPDVPVEMDELDGWRAEEFARFEEQGIFEKYVEDNFAAHKDAFVRLATNDTRKASDYPGFDALYASLDTRLSPQDVWEWLHLRIRNRVSEEVGRLLVGDWAIDTQLQRALRDFMDGGGHDLAQTPEYGFIRQREFEEPGPYGAALESARPVAR